MHARPRVLAPALLALLAITGVGLPVAAAGPRSTTLAEPPAPITSSAPAEAPAPIPDAGQPDRTSLDLEATYVARARLTWKAGKIAAHTAIHIRNTSGGPIEHLELNAIPARIGRMHLGGVTVDGANAHARIVGQTIMVPLGRTLGVGETTDVAVDYVAWFRTGDAGHDFLWSHSNGVISAYRWIPWVSRKTTYETGWHGDPFVTPISPSVRVTLTADVALRYATSGHVVSHSGKTWTYAATNVRDFNFTAARDYHVLTGKSNDGDTTIQVFTRTLNGHVILKWAKRAMADYERRIGEYPYPTLTYGESSGGIGMESPAHIWLPHRFNSAILPFLVGHETAHQWFYAVVGNDQTTDPFADEAVAELLDRNLFDYYRGSRCSKSRLDLTMYQYTSSCYYEQIYIQGTNWLAGIRDRMGATAFWNALSGYWHDQKWQISSNRKLLQAIRAAAGDWVLPRFHARFPSLY